MPKISLMLFQARMTLTRPDHGTETTEADVDRVLGALRSSQWRLSWSMAQAISPIPHRSRFQTQGRVAICFVYNNTGVALNATRITARSESAGNPAGDPGCSLESATCTLLEQPINPLIRGLGKGALVRGLRCWGIKARNCLIGRIGVVRKFSTTRHQEAGMLAVTFKDTRDCVLVLTGPISMPKSMVCRIIRAT